MPELSPKQTSVLTDLFGNISASLSLSLSEQLNREVVLEAPAIQALPIQSTLERVDTVHQTIFALSQPVPAEGVFLLSSDLSYICIDLIDGNEGLDPPNELTDAQIESLSNAVAGLARGLAIALTNTIGHPFEIETCQSHLGVIALPPVFALDPSLTEIKYSLSIPGVMDSEITLLLPFGFMQILAPEGQEADAMSADDGMGISEDDLAAMLGELSGVGEPAPKMGGAGSSVTPAPFGNFPTAPSDSHYPRGMELILDIPLDVTVELGRVRMLIKDVLELASGSIVELDRVAGESVDLLVNGRLIAKGEVVVIEDNFGLRLTEIISPADRVAGLGKGR